MTDLERIQQLGLKQRHIANLINVSFQTLNHYLHCRREMKIEKIEMLNVILTTYEKNMN